MVYPMERATRTIYYVLRVPLFDFDGVGIL
jgi:hypothetical protein